MYELCSIFCSSTRDFLVRNNGEQVKVNGLKGKVVGMYFSASNLESCQLFTRKLMKVYNAMKKYGHFEIVFVSNDEDVESFKADFSKLPWLAIPFVDSDMRDKLYELFHVKELPYLVILDENRKISTGAVKIVEEGINLECTPDIKQQDKKERNKQSEEKGDEDKWNYSLESLLVSETRDYLIDNNGTKVQVSNLAGKVTMLFFSDSSSPACKNFLPKLVKVYHEMKEKYNNSVEVIYISYFGEQVKVDEFFVTMPWLALSFVNGFDDDRRIPLTRLYNVKQIPTVIVLGSNGMTVTVNGRNLIECYGAEAYPFTSEQVKEIELENDRRAKLWPNKINTEVHDHELSLFKQEKYYYCGRCDELGRYRSYHCDYSADCNFDLHPTCALGDDYKAEMVHELKNPELEARRNDSLESLLINKSGNFVINSTGEKVPISNLVGKTTMLFFAAGWCPPCHFVLPKLVQKYQEDNKEHNNFVEVIIVSTDEDRFSFDKFFAIMPWLALPFRDDRIESLSQFFKVKAIPLLITIDPTGKGVESKGWELASYPGAQAYPFTYEWVKFQALAQKMVIFWPKTVTKNLHDHELCLVEQILYDCDCCHEVGCNWSYKCEVCVFNLHPSCALDDNKGEVKG